MFRTISPKQHAQFLAHISTFDLDGEGGNTAPADTQQDFDAFYDTALQLLERFCPQRSITVTSRSPLPNNCRNKGEAALKESINESWTH